MLQRAADRLNADGCEASPGMDARVLLGHEIGQSQAWLLANQQSELEEMHLAGYESLIARRCQGTPVAYLTGRKEFWSLELVVNASVLIPRPETELVVERALERLPRDGTVLDLGTGSGAIAIAIATERPDCRVVGVDQSVEALDVAMENRRRLGASNVELELSDWYGALAHRRFDLIVGNPPYVEPDDEHLAGEIRFEPQDALIAGDGGMADLRTIAEGAKRNLLASGWLIVEHGFEQGARVRDLMRNVGFGAVQTHNDLSGQERATEGCFQKL